MVACRLPLQGAFIVVRTGGLTACIVTLWKLRQQGEYSYRTEQLGDVPCFKRDIHRLVEETIIYIIFTSTYRKR